MKKYIFALLILIGCQDEEQIYCIDMKVSNALPIQFWRNGVASFNQSKYSGVDKFCWFQPINCDDVLKIQIDAQNPEYDGDIVDGDGSNFTQSDRGPSFADWNLALSKVTLNTSYPSSSESMVVPNFLTVGQEYTFAFDVDGVGSYTSGGGNALNVFVAFFDADYTTLDSQTILAANGSTKSNSGTFNITVPVGAVYFGIQVSAAFIDSGSYEVTINNLEIQLDEGEYFLSIRNERGSELFNIELDQDSYTIFSTTISLEDYDSLCNKFVSFVLLDGDSNELFYTDLLKISSTHRDTRLIYYTNKLPFAGIAYDDNEPVFSLRVLSKFFEVRMQQEDESEPDAEGNVVKLSGSVKPQKQFIAEAVPPYMVEKLTLIFKHSTIWIENEAWIAEETVEIEKLDERSPFFNVSVWLTKADNNFYSNVG